MERLFFLWFVRHGKQDQDWGLIQFCSCLIGADVRWIRLNGKHKRFALCTPKEAAYQAIIMLQTQLYLCLLPVLPALLACQRVAVQNCTWTYCPLARVAFLDRKVNKMSLVACGAAAGCFGMFWSGDCFRHRCCVVCFVSKLIGVAHDCSKVACRLEKQKLEKFSNWLTQTFISCLQGGWRGQSPTMFPHTAG